MGLWNWLFGSNKTSVENIQKLIKKIDNLTDPQEMPKKIMMLQHALSLVQYQSKPELWADLQERLGISLSQNPQGDRGENIEQAIEHYNQALKVYTYNDFPIDWAVTQNNLAAAYLSRIKGEKAENIEQAIEFCNRAIQVRTPKDFPVQWAMTLINLGIGYWQRIKGKKAENIEKAIEYYNEALKIYTQKDFPVQRALTQAHLAVAYFDRILGDKAENIEKAIEYCNQSIQVISQKDFPIQWAMAINNLGASYWQRIQGDRAENIEKAIEYYNLLQRVYTQKDFPMEWAKAQNNLANAYNYRILGDRAENIEKAIEYCNQALKVNTYQYSPVDWAMVQNNLSIAYWQRIKGDRVQNLEQAIEHCNQALEVYTYQGFPLEWAGAKNNLGSTYCDRILGDRADNIEKAIESYNQTLYVYTPTDFPVQWAIAQNNLATAYSDRILGDRAENIEKAIEYCKQADEIYTHKDFPVQWTTVQNNFAVVFLSRIRGNRAENIEKAIEHNNQALKVRNQKDFPVDWAMTQNNLALAYKERILGNRAENIEKAISHCRSALEIFKIESMPNYFHRTCRLLGYLYLDTDQWEEAANYYKDAIKAGDLLYRSGLSAESKTFEVGENSYIYQNATLATCRLGLSEEALLILERGKTRLLSEALRLKMKKPEIVPKEEWVKYESAAEKYRIATKSSDSKEDYARKEYKAQKALEELDIAVKVVQRYNPKFQKEIEISDLLSILDEETALLTFCMTEKRTIGFIVSKLKGIQSIDIAGFKAEDLNNLLFKTNDQEPITGGWVGDYMSYLNALGTKFQDDAFKSWQKTFNDILTSIGTKLLNPLLTELPPQTKKLILIPSGGLFLLPLHSAPLSNDQLLCQKYCISYAPSIQLLKEMQNKVETIEGKDLYAVINPEEDPTLVFSGFEVKTISDLFRSFLKPSLMSYGEIATRATVLDIMPGKAYLHFSCHGSYNWNDPSQSGLHLVGGRTLSLADLQNDIVDISSARLVTLSACETGITDIMRGSADEFVGLPAGFMLSGVPCVVSSLWSVPDISTALLMQCFYSNHIVKGMDIPLALQDAQLWVRDLTSRQVADYVEKCYYLGKWEGKSKEIIERYREHYLKLVDESPDEKPFQHPYYWAAFTVNGA